MSHISEKLLSVQLLSERRTELCGLIDYKIICFSLACRHATATIEQSHLFYYHLWPPFSDQAQLLVFHNSRLLI